MCLDLKRFDSCTLFNTLRKQQQQHRSTEKEKRGKQSILCLRKSGPEQSIRTAPIHGTHRNYTAIV